MKLLFKLFFCIITVLALLSVVGCSSVLSQKSLLDYVPAGKICEKPRASNLFIDQITDLRPLEERELPVLSGEILIMVPLWPYSSSKLNPTTRYTYLQNDLPVLIQQLTTEDLRASGLFREINVADINNPGISPVPEAYRLQLTLKDSVWKRHVTSYCLSYPGAFLWIFGMPVSYGSVSLEIEVVLLDQVSNKILGKKLFNREIPCTEFIYDQVDYRPPKSEFRLAELFPQFTEELRAFISGKIK